MFHTLTTKPVVALIRICNQFAFNCPQAETDAEKQKLSGGLNLPPGFKLPF